MKFEINYNIITQKTNVTEEDIRQLGFVSEWLKESFDIDDYLVLSFKERPYLNQPDENHILVESSALNTYLVYAKKGHHILLNNNIFLISEDNVIIEKPNLSHQHIKLH